MVDIYVKADLFQFIVDFEFSIKNIRFFGNDIVISDYKNNLCLRQRKVCCFSFLNDCAINNTNFTIGNHNLDKNSMFLLKNDNEEKITKLSFTNVSFLNFYAVKEEVGWKQIIYVLGSAKTIFFLNFTLSNFFFPHGVLFAINNAFNFFKIMNKIKMENVLVENYAFIYNQNNNFNEIKDSCFIFQNFSTIFVNITNLKILSIILPSTSPSKYVFIFESAFNLPESELYINGLTFENNTDIGFIYVNTSLKIAINDFIFKNILSTKETSLFAFFFNKLNTMLNNGLFYAVSSYNSSLFLCQKGTNLILNSIKLNYMDSNIVNCSESPISIADFHFENIKADYLMFISNANLTIVNSNFSSMILKQAAFFLSNISNIIYNESWCMNISTPKFIFFHSTNFNVSTRSKILFFFIRILYTSNDLIFLDIEDLTADVLFLRDFQISDCSSLLLINIKASFQTVDIFNISIKRLKYSSHYLIYLEQTDQSNYLFTDISCVKLTHIVIQNCVFENKIFSFKVLNNVVMLEINDFNFDSTNANSLFEFQSISTMYKYFKVFLNNFTLTQMKGDISDSGLLYVVNSITSPVDSIVITNLIVSHCTSIQILHLRSKYNYIIIANLSISFIYQNNDNFMIIEQPYEDDDISSSKMNCSLSFYNVRIKSAVIATKISIAILIITYNRPVKIYFNNSYIENFKLGTMFYLSSPLIRLISVDIFYLEFYNVKSINDNFFFLYSSDAPMCNVSISNIYIHDSDTFFLILLTQMFDNINIKNITIVNIHYNLYYIIAIFQAESQSTEYAKVEIDHFIFLDVELNNDWDSIMSYLAFAVFNELMMENVIIKNMISYEFDLPGISYFGLVGTLIKVRLNKIDFFQNIWSNLDQVFLIEYISDYLEVINSRFEIEWRTPPMRRFQSLYVIYSYNVVFINNEFIGMSTIERPEYKFEEIGVVSFMAEESYEVPSSGVYNLLIKSKIL